MEEVERNRTPRVRGRIGTLHGRDPMRTRLRAVEPPIAVLVRVVQGVGLW